MRKGIEAQQAEIDRMQVDLEIAERHLVNPNPAVF